MEFPRQRAGPGGWEGSIFENHGLVQDGTQGGGLSTAGPGPRSSFEAEVCCLLGDLW